MSAEDIVSSNYTIDFYIEYDKVLVDTSIQFDSPMSGNVEFRLPLDARAITMHIDGGKVEPYLDGNILGFDLEGNDGLRYQYITESFLERDSFIANVKLPFASDLLAVRVSLPDEAVLRDGLEDSDISTPSVAPKPTRLETDGRTIDIVWIAESVDQDAELPLLVRYDYPGKSTTIFMILVAAIFLSLIVAYMAFLRKPKRAPPKVIFLRPPKKVQGGAGIEKHLKEDEEQIVTILKDRDGRCEQGTLRVITGFSKAKLSGLLKELEDRKIVHKEKRGKKNLVFLKD